MRFTVPGGKNRVVRILSVVLGICVLFVFFTLPSAVSFASSQEELVDIKAHWAEAVILKWVNQGLAKGYGDGRFGPNDSITRAEFVTLLNRIFGYQQISKKSFPDVKAGAWYAGEIAKAYQAGIISGDNNGNMNPEAVISRQEAVVILARAFSLAGDDLDAALKYSDVGQIAEWALGSVGTMTKKGYVTGRPGNLFAPKANLSRCEAVKMIDNAMGEVINTAGTYTRVVPGNMVISSPGVTLKNTYIAGDLYLTEGIGSNTIQLIDVEVKGRTFVADGVDKKYLLSGTKTEQGNIQGQPTPKPTSKPGSAQPTSVPGLVTPTTNPVSPTTPNPTTQPTPTQGPTVTPTQAPTTAPTATPTPTEAPTPKPAEANIYVSPTGNARAKGTYDDPLDLQTVLNSNSPAKPGDLVILKEGRYSGRFVSNVRGKPNSPVIFAGEPGKRVIIEGIYKEGDQNHALFLNQSSWVEFRDLEITASGTDRSSFTTGLEINAQNSKVINCIIHDTAQGIFSSSSATNNELYGNIIYNNGYYSESYGRGRGHGIYVQNLDGTKRIANNILFFGYGFGIHAYAESGAIKGLDFERNVWFRAGASCDGSDLEGTSDGMLIGGATPVDRTRVIENYSWSPQAYSRNVRLGWGSTVENEFIELKDNYFIGNIYVQGKWKDGEVKNNHFFGERIDIQEEDFPVNTYHNKLPDENKIVLHENEYDPNRIDLIIYNWEEFDSVNVPLGSLINIGKSFEIYSVFDLWGEPVVSGVYSGEAIQVPMGTKDAVQPIGYPNAITASDDPGKSFGVFIIRIK